MQHVRVGRQAELLAAVVNVKSLVPNDTAAF